MSWSDRLRRAMANFKAHIEARPLALPLAIAYTGENPVGFWRMTEVLLGILLEAGFERREAIVLIRAVSNLLSGYLLLVGQDDLGAAGLDAHELELRRRRVELSLMSLPRQEFPNIVESAADMANVWLSDPDNWWRETVDLIVFGLEAILQKRVR
jgi:hypothetical protein